MYNTRGPYVQYGGPLAVRISAAHVLHHDAERVLVDEAVAVADDRRVLEQLQVLRLPQRRAPRPVLHHVEPLHEVDDALRDVAHRAHRALRAAANGLQLDIRLHCAARVALSSAPWPSLSARALPVPALKSVALVREGSTERPRRGSFSRPASS